MAIIEINQLSPEIKDLLKTRGFRSARVVDNSFNTVVSGIYGQNTVYLRVDNNIQNQVVRTLRQPESCGYFDPNKYQRQQKLLTIANLAGVPTPTILDVGHLDNGTPWCLETEAEGISVNKIWAELSNQEKVTFVGILGQLLARLHSFQSISNVNAIETYWNDKLSIVTDNLLRLKIYNSEEIEKIAGSANKLKDKAFDQHRGIMSTVHLEALFKHLFVLPNLNISGVIDWDTGELQGDALCDLAFTAFWNSDEGEYSENSLTLRNSDLFTAMIDGYSNVAPATTSEVLKAVPFYDLMWYLNILWVREAQGVTTSTERRKNKVLKIIKLAN